jgi:hypothetical protein
LPPLVVVEGPATGFRHRARLAIRGRAASPKIGIFQEHTHRITDVPRCVIHHPLVNEVAAAVKRAVRRTGVTLYGDGSHRGCLRYLQVVVERSTQTAQVVLVANDVTPDALAPTADLVRSELGGRLHSLWWNGNTTTTNAILGARWHRWAGPETTVETIAGARVFYPPGAFGQANLPLADRLVAQVHDWIPPDARVLEMHAGVGAIGLGLLARGQSVVFNEFSRFSLAGLNLGIDALGPDARRRASVRRGPAARPPGRDRRRRRGRLRPPAPRPRSAAPRPARGRPAGPPRAGQLQPRRVPRRSAGAARRRQDAARGARAVRALPVHGARRDRRAVRAAVISAGQRQHHARRRPGARRGLQRHAAAVPLDDLADEREAEPGAFP